MAVKLCTASGYCIRCQGNIEAAFNSINNIDGNKFVCCGGNCIRISDVSTVETVEREMAPDDDDEDLRPHTRGNGPELSGGRAFDH